MKLSNYTHFFNYDSILKIRDKLGQDAYYKAVRALCNYFEEKYHTDDNLLRELNKIRKLVKKPSCTPDIYTPSDEEMFVCLERLKHLNKNIYLFYITLMYSGVRIVEMDEFVCNKYKYRITKQDGFIKVIINSKRNTKSCYFIYLPDWIELPTNFDLKYLNKFLTKHKEIVRPKYIRNWFYLKCIELGIPNGVADFYQGRSPISIGNKHYLDKERMADKLYPLIKSLLSRNT